MGSQSTSNSFEAVSNEQSTAAAGGGSVGSDSNGNVLNITSSDVNALVANQNVTETALNDYSNVSDTALSGLVTGNENADVLTAAALASITANANDAEQVGLTLGTQAQDIASQVLSGAGDGTQETYTPAPITVNNSSPGQASAAPTSGFDANSIALYLGIAAAAITLIYYFRQK